MRALSGARCINVRGKFNNASALGRSLYWCQALHIMNKDRYQSTSARRALALLNSPQALFISNNDRYQNNERPRTLELLNSPPFYKIIHFSVQFSAIVNRFIVKT